MQYWIDNATAIMQLCLGGGFVVLVLVLSRALLVLTRLLRRMDSIAAIVERYAEKPLSMIAELEGLFFKLIDWFRR